jgi:hypothetical protein
LLGHTDDRGCGRLCCAPTGRDGRDGAGIAARGVGHVLVVTAAQKAWDGRHTEAQNERERTECKLCSHRRSGSRPRTVLDEEEVRAASRRDGMTDDGSGYDWGMSVTERADEPRQSRQKRSRPADQES